MACVHTRARARARARVRERVLRGEVGVCTHVRVSVRVSARACVLTESWRGARRGRCTRTRSQSPAPRPAAGSGPRQPVQARYGSGPLPVQARCRVRPAIGSLAGPPPGRRRARSPRLARGSFRSSPGHPPGRVGAVSCGRAAAAIRTVYAPPLACIGLAVCVPLLLCHEWFHEASLRACCRALFLYACKCGRRTMLPAQMQAK